MSDYSTWIGSLLRNAARFGVVFVQLGSANEPARRALCSADVQTVEAVAFIETEAGGDVDTIVLDRVEALLQPALASRLGPLRERVFRAVDEGQHVVLLSRSPKIAFPDVPGSSLLDDARFVSGPVSAAFFNSVPACTIDGRDIGAVLRDSLEELGAEVCASLDRVLFESMLLGQEALSSLVARELEALDGAAITVEVAGRREWAFPRQLVTLKDALSSVLGGLHAPQPQLGDVTSGLWMIERLLRSAVRDRAITAWGQTWKKQILNEALREQVLKRARESAYLAATSVSHLRDPLEWLTLGELLEFRNLKAIGDLGLEPALWRNFSAQVMPIRNRTAHTRYLHPRDSADVLKWLNVLKERL